MQTGSPQSHSEPVSVCFGDQRGQHLTITVLRRENPGASDYNDANWLVVSVDICAGSFRGRFDATFVAYEFDPFKKQLEALQQTLKGIAEFETLEGQLSIKIEGDGHGHLTMTCVALDAPGIGNSLKFALNLDQTYLPAIVRELSQLMLAYPVINPK